MSEELNLRQAAERLIYWSNRIAAATTDEEENKCCTERDKLFAVFRKVDAERANKPEGLIAGGEQVRSSEAASHNTPPAEEDRGERDLVAELRQYHADMVEMDGGEAGCTALYRLAADEIERLRLLSSPRVEGALAALIEIRDGTVHFWVRERAEAAIRSLSPQVE